MLQAYAKKTGISARKIAVFRPERILLHEAIAEVVTKVALPAGNEVGKLRKIVNDIIDTIKANPSFKKLATINIDNRFESFKRIVTRKLERNAGSAQQTDQYAQLIDKYSSFIRKHYASSNKRMKLREEQATIVDLVAWALLRKEYQTDIETLVSEALTKLEEEKKCSFLTMKSGFERAVWVLAGGPASGKRSIFNTKIKKQVIKKQRTADELSAAPQTISGLLERIQDKDDDVRREAATELISMNMATPEDLLKALRNEVIDACSIHADLFKPLLLEAEEPYHAMRTHEESSHIRDLVLKKLENMLTKTEKAPNIIWDTVHPDLKALESILEDNPKINLYVTTCPVLDIVEGNKTIRGSVGRAFDRAKDEFLAKGVKNPAYGSYIPTAVVLDGHKKVSESFPSLVSSGKYSLEPLRKPEHSIKSG
jgi:hypothetical protein